MVSSKKKEKKVRKIKSEINRMWWGKRKWCSEEKKIKDFEK